MILSYLWHSPYSSSADQLLGGITEDLSSLIESGINAEINGLGCIHFDIFIQSVHADELAQSKITQRISHNGYYACRLCELEAICSATDNTCTYS
ncbi:unnamed protein product [Rotaria sp. Silwood2]|nr:unnamed protein product [Rotaria sp. Silwood2]CAF3934276.1 unnamed protein product [Rotaria sp. Silwood2]